MTVTRHRAARHIPGQDVPVLRLAAHDGTGSASARRGRAKLTNWYGNPAPLLPRCSLMTPSRQRRTPSAKHPQDYLLPEAA